jgi:tight adherence protein C
MITLLVAIFAVGVGYSAARGAGAIYDAWEGHSRRVRLGNLVAKMPTRARTFAPMGYFLSGMTVLARRVLERPAFRSYGRYLGHLLRRADPSGGIGPEHVLVRQALAAVVGFAAFLSVSGNLFLALTVMALGAAFPILRLREEGARRERGLLRGLPDALETFALCVEAGLTLEQSFEQYHRNAGAGPLRDEFAKVLQQTRAGSSRKEALGALRDRLRMTDVSLFVTSVVHAERTGVGIAGTLKRLSSTLRDQQVQRAEKAVQEMPVKMLMPLLLCIMPVTFLVLFGPLLLQFLR